jgi:hypothetical protein
LALAELMAFDTPVVEGTTLTATSDGVDNTANGGVGNWNGFTRTNI